KVKEEMNLRVNVELSPHTLRRCFATYNAISGMPLPVLQKVLGHSKISTTALYIKDSDLSNLVKFRPDKKWLKEFAEEFKRDIKKASPKKTTSGG
ncbi:1338_t:CDS:2, partial [Paraglomus brasilianum]